MPVQWTLILPPLAGSPTQQIQLQGTLKVGRASSNDIAIEDHSTSSSHATMEVRGNELVVRDHGSTNGTTINGGPRLAMGEWASVPDGATLRFGVVNTRIVGKEVVDLDATIPGTRPPEAAPAAAKAPPKPRVPAAPAPAIGVDPMVDPPVDESFAATISDQASGPVAAAAAAYALEQVDARLILLDEVNPRAIRITEMVHTIGRSMSVNCRIDSKLVSSEHAALSFSSNTRAFQIQDLGSSNQTVLNRVTLTPKVAHRLELDSALQFGPIEAIFRVDHDIDGQKLPPNFDLKIAEALIAAGKLTSAQLGSAVKFGKETGGFLGDGLLLSGAVSPNDWVDAARMARQNGPVVPYRGGKSSGWLFKLFVLVLLLALGVAALYHFGSDELLAKLPKLPFLDQLKGGE